ncbi:MAG: type VI secretion system baseplate subunit TssG [Acidobacteria bacterium]|jgi:type VI secretion system protein ImpH|nr:MAG: type VI secretion system baseplate subunit TssG [Acidobacteriota bacterium]GIU83139.1 MAG: type VI secretion system protein [Pyrinomonadaceae bacterium]
MNDSYSNKNALIQKVLEEPYKFEFFQLVRLLEKALKERKPVGRYGVLPEEEIARFRSSLSFEFPASEVQEVRLNDDEIPEVTINFMGMLGLLGAMPIRYSELAAERARYGDTALWSFLDIFTHRAVSLFYRAWEKYKPAINYEHGNDNFTYYLFCLIGLGTDGLRPGRMGIDDEALLPYAGLIAQKPHSAVALKNIISDYFDVPVEVLQFQGEWIELGEENATKLGQSNNLLGVNAVIGTKIWDNQSKFRLRIGPIDFKKFQAFLPVGNAHKPLWEIIKFVVGIELDFDVQLKLKAKEVPSTILTTRAKRRPMLGWTSFLKSKPFTHDDEQLILKIKKTKGEKV